MEKRLGQFLPTGKEGEDFQVYGNLGNVISKLDTSGEVARKLRIIAGRRREEGAATGEKNRRRAGEEGRETQSPGNPTDFITFPGA